MIDAKCGAISVPQRFGAFTVHSNISFPYVPVIGAFADHSITSGLESVMLEFGSEVIVGDSTKKFTPLAFYRRVGKQHNTQWLSDEESYHHAGTDRACQC